MKKILILLLWSQCVISQDTIFINNKSFEGKPQLGQNDIKFSMEGWRDCGAINFHIESAPDVHPENFWENEIKPSNGNSYVGLVARDNESWESITQLLQEPLKPQTCYTFRIDMARSKKYLSKKRLTNQTYNYIDPILLRVWSSKGNCKANDLLIVSKKVDNEQWQTFQFTFKTKSEVNSIILEAYYPSGKPENICGHILIDNMSDISEVACEE